MLYWAENEIMNLKTVFNSRRLLSCERGTCACLNYGKILFVFLLCWAVPCRVLNNQLYLSAVRLTMLLPYLTFGGLFYRMSLYHSLLLLMKYLANCVPVLFLSFFFPLLFRWGTWHKLNFLYNSSLFISMVNSIYRETIFPFFLTYLDSV